MFDAQYLFEGSALFSPWMPRQGDYLRITCEIVSNSSETLEVAMDAFEKNSEDTGDGDEITGLSNELREIDPGVYTLVIGPPVKELVRYRMGYEATTPTAGNERALFRVISNVWFDSVKA